MAQESEVEVEVEVEAAARTAERPRRYFLELLMGSGGGGGGGGGGGMERDPFVFFPIIVGVMGPRGREGEEAPPADRLVLVNPLTQGMLVLRTEGGGPDLAALLQGILGPGGGAGGPPPASKASIDAMRTVERPEAAGGEGGMEAECAICLDGLWLPEEGEGKETGVVKEMPCRHSFHGGCIEKWLGLHGSCPVCRYRMPEEGRQEGKKGREEGEEGEAAAREILVSFGFGRTAGRDSGHQQPQHPEQQQQEMEEID